MLSNRSELKMTVSVINIISKCGPKLKRRSLEPFARLSQWIKAQAHTANKEYTNAAQTFKLLDTKVSRSKLAPGVFHHECCINFMTVSCKQLLSELNYRNITN